MTTQKQTACPSGRKWQCFCTQQSVLWRLPKPFARPFLGETPTFLFCQWDDSFFSFLSCWGQSPGPQTCQASSVPLSYILSPGWGDSCTTVGSEMPQNYVCGRNFQSSPAPSGAFCKQEVLLEMGNKAESKKKKKSYFR